MSFSLLRKHKQAMSLDLLCSAINIVEKQAQIKETTKKNQSVEFAKILSNVRMCMTKAFNDRIMSKTKNGDTQVAERTYISIIRAVLKQMGYEFEEAPSQQPYDFRVKMADGSTLFLEAKKTDGKTVYFNDTCPCEKAFYIVIFTGKECKKEEAMPNMSHEEIKKQVLEEMVKKYPNAVTRRQLSKVMKEAGFDSKGYTGRKLDCWKLQWLTSNGTASELTMEKKDGIAPCVFGLNGSDFVKEDPWLAQFKAELDALKEKYRYAGKDSIMSVYPRPTYKANIDFLFKAYYDEAKIILN